MHARHVDITKGNVTGASQLAEHVCGRFPFLDDFARSAHCLLSVGRQCVYDAASDQVHAVQGPSSSSYAATEPTRKQADLAIPGSNDIDPFQYAALRQPTYDLFVAKRASSVLGDLAHVEQTAAAYFATIFLRMPILPRKTFFDKLPNLYTHPQADFTVLCLTIHLLIQRPDAVESAGHHGQTMHSSTYVTVKSFVGVLQSLAHPTMELLQAMVLLVLFEMGHGMYPAASISMATCARTARAIRLNKIPGDRSATSFTNLELEQRRRVWWALLILDRYANNELNRTFADPRSKQIHQPLHRR
jgi:hypothetical protein